MFKRVTKRSKRREQAEELGVADKISGMEDTDSDESDSDEVSSDEGQSGDAAEHKRKLGGHEEDELDLDGVTSDEDTTGLSSMTVKEALKCSIEDTSCILCPGKNLKNAQMEHVHLQSKHHQRRLKRFEALVERLSSQFEGVHGDQAALIVRLLGKPSIRQNGDSGSVLDPAAPSKRAIKKRKLAAKKEKRKRKREAPDARDEEKGNPVKRRKPSHSTKPAKGSPP